MELILRLAHLALHKVDNLFWLDHGVVLGHRADDHVTVVEKNHRWRDAFGFCIGDDLRFSVGIDMCDGREGRAQIDSDYFAFAHD